MKNGYVVSAETALQWVNKNQKQRPDGREWYSVLERRSHGGWGVFDNEDCFWVYVE